jgi:tyrosine-protein kinase Etk/Wzc
MNPSPPASSHSAASSTFSSEDDEPSISLIEILTWLGEGKRTILLFTLLAIVAAALFALWLPPLYTSRTTMLPPGSQQSSGSAAALAALGAMGGGGLASSLSVKTPDELYVALLKSDTLIRALDERLGLKAHYEVLHFEPLRAALLKNVRVSSDKKSGVITVQVDDQKPDFAARLANAHVQELTRLLGRLSVTEAKQRRIFFEAQLKETKESLIKAELNMRGVQEKSGLIVLDKQAEALINTMAAVRAQIAEREVQLKVLRTAATDQNPEVIRLNSELRALRSELSRMESSGSSQAGSSPVDLPVGRIPAAAIDFVRAKRELKLQETLLEAMVRQYEVARMDEAKDGPALQQIDPAHPAEKKSKPARTIIVISATLGGFLLGCFWVLIRRYLRQARDQDVESAAQWQAFNRAWRLR